LPHYFNVQLVIHRIPQAATLHGCDAHKEVNRMTKPFRLVVAFAALIVLAPALSACHTTAGVGEDLSQGGHALSNSANANAPQHPSP
jgi:predicted small secreted protein